MSPTEDHFPSSTLRRRKSKVDSELQLQLLHTDHRKTTKHRWSNCFAYIMKRCKLKTEVTCPSSSTNMTLTLPCELLETNHIKTGHGYTISEKPRNWSTYSSLPPPSPPVPSPLSPPPRHIMTSRQQQQQQESKNPLAIHTTNKSTTVRTLPTHYHHHHQRRQHPYRPHVLRLSLNMDQRYSYTSSIDSCDTHNNNDNTINEHDDPVTATTTTDSEPASRSQGNNNSNHRWTMDSFSQPIGLMMLRDDSYDGGNLQIRQDKEHYEAIVAASKTQHRRPTSFFYEHDYYDNNKDNINEKTNKDQQQHWNTKLEKTAPPYSCAPLAL